MACVFKEIFGNTKNALTRKKHMEDDSNAIKTSVIFFVLFFLKLQYVHYIISVCAACRH